MWVRDELPVAERNFRPVAQKLLITWAMRSTTAGSTNPWGTTIDDGWKDLVVSSAPPPPPREAMEPIARSRPLPDNFDILTEHGAPRTPSVETPVEEPSFTAGDRRLWLIAGTLMGLAALVLGLLGALTFGGLASSLSASASAPAPSTQAAVEAPRATVAESARSAAPATRPAATATRASNPRVLKAATRSSRTRHHKRIAAR